MKKIQRIARKACIGTICPAINMRAFLDKYPTRAKIEALLAFSGLFICVERNGPDGKVAQGNDAYAQSFCVLHIYVVSGRRFNGR